MAELGAIAGAGSLFEIGGAAGAGSLAAGGLAGNGSLDDEDGADAGAGSLAGGGLAGAGSRASAELTPKERRTMTTRSSVVVC